MAALADSAKDSVPQPRSGDREPLRLGLLLDGYAVPAWVEQVLARITTTGVGEIALLVLNDAVGSTATVDSRGHHWRRASAWFRNRQALGYALYQRFDHHRHRTGELPLRLVDLTERLATAPVIRVRPRMTKFCDYFEDTDLECIAGYDLDVALRFGFRILKGGALKIARHGVWSYHHGDNTQHRGGPPGYWEVMEQHQVTGAVLQRLTEDLDGGEVVKRSFSSTSRFSVTANRANCLWQAAELLPPALRELSEQQRASPTEPRPHWSAYSQRLYTRPRNGEVLRHSLALAGRWAWLRVRSMFVREQWSLGYHLSAGDGREADVPDGIFYRFKELHPPPDRFWADPFPANVDGRHYLFFEESLYAEPHGHICVVELGSSGLAGEPRIVLQRPYHVSYPAVFEWHGDWYMTPETASRNAVELYRAACFPDGWEHVADLVTGLRAVDSTIAQIDGCWWMFVGVMIPGASEVTALHLFSAGTPLGPWTPHIRNPVKIDVRCARPGGRVFHSGGRYYRVAQDGSARYGGGLRVFVIDRLDQAAFSETEVARITPSWRKGLFGVHTLNASGSLTTIDMLQVRRRF